jgi:hypothetical protein
MKADSPIFRILNLADFHFGPYSHWYKTNPQDEGLKLAEEIIAVIDRHKEEMRFEAVILGGDFSWAGGFSNLTGGAPHYHRNDALNSLW